MPTKRRFRNPATLAANVPSGVVQIIGPNHTYFLREPIDLNIHRDNGHFVIEYAPLNLSVYGDTQEEAFSAFADMFETAWEHIAESPDRLLTGEARDLKAAFRKHVERTG
ncbi:MAG TPA: hypothetical protein VNY05_34195 [Candidatus Acidoferrales bacterium]|jgi:hypothetical protein|nr:hypothetical protein [Candidatus Acidoferrales bacterium]